MIVYQATKKEFIDSVINDTIAEDIFCEYQQKIGNTSISEKRSWQNSMEYMYKVLNEDEIPENCGIAIEFKVPYTSRRIDFILTGRNERLQDYVIVIELKQWEKAKRVENKDGVVNTFVGGANRDVNHPSYQAWSYVSFIEDYNENVQNHDLKLIPCAYLHNYNDNNNEIFDSIYKEHIEKAPVFIKGEVLKLRKFIKQYITYGDDKENLYLIENGKLRPSKSLQDSLASMIKGNKEFIMIDEQKVIYEEALYLAKKSYQDGSKRVLIVEGGPGTGKSVLAINLLVELTKANMVVNYISKNSTPRNIYASKLKGTIKKTRIDNLFKGSGSYINSEEGEFDVLIADEAHRLNNKSGMFRNLGENQIKEIIHASKFSIFFIDEYQKVTLADIGSIEEIEKHAKYYNAEVYKTKLDSQFRCNGSDGYLSWITDVLGIEHTANYDGFDKEYDFRIFDDPNELRNNIVRLNKMNNKSRLLAGYCWNWDSKAKNRPDIHDIQINEYNFSMSWNLGNTSTFGIDENSVEQVGCIHTSQGIEFDYVGVIIGKDLIYRDGKVLTDYSARARTDQSLKGIKKLAKEDPALAYQRADQIIKNTYRTLLSRGQKGCFVFCCDKQLAEYFKKRYKMARVSNMYRNL